MTPYLTDLQQLARTAQWLATEAINFQRQRQAHKPMDYIQFNLPAQMGMFPDGRNMLLQRVLGRSPISLVELEQAFKRIAEDKRPRGVILSMRGLALSLADLQTLRQSILRLREAGKQVIAYAQSYDMASYYIACACDQILLQEGGDVFIVGLSRQQIYLKDALESVGLRFESIAISPYKSAADQFALSAPSPENEAQTNWLLDSWFGQLCEGIAQGRAWDIAHTQQVIDNAPYTDRSALEQGIIDGTCHEETLSKHLHSAHILLWEDADGLLALKLNPAEQYVAVLNLNGTIMNGESGAPPVDIPLPMVGDARIGDVTTVNILRHILKDKHARALVVYIDSPGGSATASEAIARTLDEIAKTRPVVACMGGVAASGGYYIASSADEIIAQAGTVTGSIGVILGKLVNSDALRKLRFNAYQYQRGAHAGILTSQSAFSESERAKMLDAIQRIYEQFVGRVADSRKMKPEAVDAIGGGRVWTGAQAHDNGLVDELGGLLEAVKRARELAKLPTTAPARLVRMRVKPLPAELAEKLDPAAALRYWTEGVEQLTNGRAQLLMPMIWR